MHPIKLLTLKEQEEIFEGLTAAIDNLIQARDKFLKGENAQCINRTFDAQSQVLGVLKTFVCDCEQTKKDRNT